MPATCNLHLQAQPPTAPLHCRRSKGDGRTEVLPVAHGTRARPPASSRPLGRFAKLLPLQMAPKFPASWRLGAERSPRAPPTLPPPSATTCHLAPVERFIPVIDDRGRAGQPAVLNGVPTDSGHLAVPRQNCKPDTATSGPGWVPAAPRLPFQNQAAQTRLLYPDHSTCVTASSWRTWTRREGPGEGQRGLRWATVRILSLKRRHR